MFVCLIVSSLIVIQNPMCSVLLIHLKPTVCFLLLLDCLRVLAFDIFSGDDFLILLPPVKLLVSLPYSSLDVFFFSSILMSRLSRRTAAACATGFALWAQAVSVTFNIPLVGIPIWKRPLVLTFVETLSEASFIMVVACRSFL